MPQQTVFFVVEVFVFFLIFLYVLCFVVPDHPGAPGQV